MRRALRLFDHSPVDIARTHAPPAGPGTGPLRSSGWGITLVRHASNDINDTNDLYGILMCRLSVLVFQAQGVGLAKPRMNPVHLVDELGVRVRQLHHRHNRGQVVLQLRVTDFLRQSTV